MTMDQFMSPGVAGGAVAVLVWLLFRLVTLSIDQRQRIEALQDAVQDHDARHRLAEGRLRLLLEDLHLLRRAVEEHVDAEKERAGALVARGIAIGGVNGSHAESRP